MKYDDGIGRFTSIDPLFEKYAGWTPYQYSMNNPVNLKDDNGKWVTADHNKIIDRAFTGILTSKEISILKVASSRVDKLNLNMVEQYKHGMRAPGQSVEDAKSKFYKFLDEKKSDYAKSTNSQVGFSQLGEGMHAISDSKCPSHSGFQVWLGDPINQDESKPLKMILGVGPLIELVQSIAGGTHSFFELYYGINNDKSLDDAVGAVKKYYNEAQKQKVQTEQNK